MFKLKICCFFIVAESPKALPEKKIKTKVVENNAGIENSVAETGNTGSGTLKFNADMEVNTKETREPISFKMDDKRSGTGVTQNSEQLAPEESEFKAYPGYPKHQVALDLLPTQVNSKWTFNGADFNYKSNSASAMGFVYRYYSTPMLSFSLDYSRYDVSINAGTVTAGSVLNIAKSDTTVDNYGFKSNFCKTLQSNFFQQICGGLDLGVESYPLLDFTGGSTLSLGKVQDIIIGANVGYNHPLANSVLLKTKLGYNLGTGAGSSGALSTKTNNSLYLKGDFEWMVWEHHGASVGAEYKMRNAEVEGKRGGNDERWKSSITTTALNAGYVYSF